MIYSIGNTSCDSSPDIRDARIGGLRAMLVCANGGKRPFVRPISPFLSSTQRGRQERVGNRRGSLWEYAGRRSKAEEKSNETTYKQ